MNPAQQNQNMQHVKASKAILGLSDSSQCQDDHHAPVRQSGSAANKLFSFPGAHDSMF
jgi:hypothetical protein